MDKEVELKFIEHTLQHYGARLKSALIKEISKKDLVSLKGSPHLKDNIRFEVARTGINGYKFSLYFPDYGRFVEIQYFKGKPNTSDLAFKQKKGTDSNSKLSKSIADKVGRRKKDTRWYSKTAYASLNPLIGHLMYGLTDTLQQTLKEQLNQPL
jgi:hypothetical protein